jgi:predicted  nucleic acid-binding Zn-ribbon protein
MTLRWLDDAVNALAQVEAEQTALGDELACLRKDRHRVWAEADALRAELVALRREARHAAALVEIASDRAHVDPKTRRKALGKARRILADMAPEVEP